MARTLSAFEERRLHKKRKFRARTAASSAQNREANRKAPEITLPKAPWDTFPNKRLTSNDGQETTDSQERHRQDRKADHLEAAQ